MTKRKLYNDEVLLNSLSVDAYKWFTERVNGYYAQCKNCNGACEIQIPNELINIGLRRQGREANALWWEACAPCVIFTEKMERFARIYFETVPPRYRGFYLSSLASTDQVRKVSTERQNEIINGLRTKPEASYAFFGPAGTSKTTWTTALYADNLYRYIVGGERNPVTGKKIGPFPIRSVNAKKLLDDFTDYAMHKNDSPEMDDIKPRVEPPAMTREKIEYWTKNGIRARLFLGEVDKIGRETESRLANLFDVIDALYEHNGQLVICSNLTQPEFSSTFGTTLARRIVEMCVVVNLFPSEK